MKCKRSIALVALALTMALVPVAMAQAKKPLRIEVDGVAEPFGWSADITSGPFTGCTMLWYIRVVIPRGQNVYFFEEWEIWDGDTLVLAGYDEGVSRLKKGEATGNGRVTYANEYYTYLIGCKEHFTGAMTGPDTFTGTVQIN